MLTRVVLFGLRALTYGLSRSDGRDTFVLMAPSIEGSRGDAAMMEVLLSNLRRKFDGRVVLLCYRRSERYQEFVDRFRVEVRSLEEFARQPLELRALLRRTHTFRFIGADIVDGFYSVRTTLLRLAVAQTFAHAGGDARMISFSFSASPTQNVCEMWRQLPSSLGLLVRDPESQRRLERLLGRSLPRAADLAFLLEPDPAGVEDVVARIEGERARGQVVVGVGVNALLLDASGRRALGAILSQLAAENPRLSLWLVAHDFRANSSDLDAARDAASNVAAEVASRVSLIDRAYGPRQIKAIAGHLDAVVSGRMHFSIAALSQGVPAFCMRYQGKVEGLLELVGLGSEIDNVSVPSEAVNRDWKGVAERVRLFLDRRAELGARISRELEGVKQQSALNLQFSRLEGGPPS
ncbi:MAG TPA: polysaccharide pyruvyl transferase family protein [Polyangiaceae bacterium]|nr:polysaccharide pyruvyl transferase family protein [Polyangiaceae bacterium]